MQEFNYLPLYRIGLNEISDGIEIRTPTFCCRNCMNNQKCLEHYQRIVKMPDGEYVCPYGFVSSVFSDDTGNKYVFTAVRLEGVYNSKLADPKLKQARADKKAYRKITSEELIDYKKYFLEYKDGIEKYQRLKDFVEDIFHDLRKFNAQLIGKSQVLYNKSQGSKQGMKFLDLSQNISAVCAFMRLRLDAYDFMYNEIPMNATEKTNYNIYKIFDKVKHCLSERARDKNITIVLEPNGQCGDIKAYDCIELLPYILLDNGLKYSYNNKEILVKLTDDIKCCKFQIISEGLSLQEGEIDRIFERGFRGENARQHTSEGSGIGLYTAYKICELHNATIQAFNEKDKFVIDVKINKEYNI